jgi:hypothetical protein
MALSSHYGMMGLQPNYFDLLLFNVKMPSLNGFQLCEQIKRIDVTVFDVYYKSLAEFCPSLDVTCFIRKLVTSSEFLRRIGHELKSQN